MFDKDQLSEWITAIDAVIEYDSPELAKQIVQNLNARVNIMGKSGYTNTINKADQPIYPGDLNLESKINAVVRWNAMAIVLKANKESSELGGHIASYASSSILYEVGLNHFWYSYEDGTYNGDLVFFQGHSAPGIYARSFVEGFISEKQLYNFRQETEGNGLSSYPHPWLIPNYWQFPTVSMGLGPLMAIHQARFMKYIEDRGLIKFKRKRFVWCFIGDGETSEPETLGNIHIAARDKLDNLIFVINCNLQRLDGPVNGNGKIIQDLEGVFSGAGWRVIKVIWGSGWDKLLDKDDSGKLQQLMMETLDGEYQNYRSKDGAYIRQNFFGKYPETLQLVSNMTDHEIWELTRGGHDMEKVYAAYHAAVNNTQHTPTVILAKTIKGFGMSKDGESRNIAHQQKKLSLEGLIYIRNKFNLPITDTEIEKLPFITFEPQSDEFKYLKAKRAALGGRYPLRMVNTDTLSIPDISIFDGLIHQTNDRPSSTTMVFVKLLNLLLKNHELGKLVIPIVPDESRTFGMEGLFRQLGIWSHVGQLYTSEDSAQLMCYKEDTNGQMLQEGINEAGAMSIWAAAGTSYTNHGMPVIPFYIFYSMFGFQRIGDIAWAAGDMRARGFLMGATSGRTTLNGEGLQHADGHSHIHADLIPNCESYDPTFSYELATIIHHGLEQMYVHNQDKFYYITLMNENYIHPALPNNKDTQRHIINGGYLFNQLTASSKLSVNLMGCGTIFREVIAAADILNQDYQINVNIYSITSYNKLYRDIIDVNRHNMLYSDNKQYFIKQLLNDTSTATVTVSSTDYVRKFADQIREAVSGQYIVLGTDGFGRSDYRAKLRQFFEINRYYVALAALHGLLQQKLIQKSLITDFIAKHSIDISRCNPWET